MNQETRQSADEPTEKLSLYEEELYGEQEAGEAMRQLVIFCLGEEWYGIHILNVYGVVPVPDVTLLPYVPGHIMGAFNLRGTIVSVTNLKPIFGLPEGELGEKSRVVVIGDRKHGVTTGLLVDGSVEAVEVPLSKIEAPVPMLDAERQGLIEGQVEWQGRLIAVLNTQKVLEKTKGTA